MSSTSETFTVRWGKLSLALLGAVAVVAVPVTIVLALTVGASLWATLVALAVAVFSVAGLRASAVRDRRKKAWKQAAATVPAALIASAAQANQASQASQASQAAEAADADDAASATEGVQPTRQATDLQRAEPAQDLPFDVLAHEVDSEVLESAPVVAASPESSDSSESPAQEATAEGWEPREVPAPSYVGATPVRRATPAPLPREETKRAEIITSIRQAEAKRVEGENAQRAERLNLDAVLQRRRA